MIKNKYEESYCGFKNGADHLGRKVKLTFIAFTLERYRKTTLEHQNWKVGRTR